MHDASSVDPLDGARSNVDSVELALSVERVTHDERPEIRRGKLCCVIGEMDCKSKARDTCGHRDVELRPWRNQLEDVRLASEISQKALLSFKTVPSVRIMAIRVKELKGDTLAGNGIIGAEDEREGPLAAR